MLDQKAAGQHVQQHMHQMGYHPAGGPAASAVGMGYPQMPCNMLQDDLDVDRNEFDRYLKGMQQMNMGMQMYHHRVGASEFNRQSAGDPHCVASSVGPPSYATQTPPRQSERRYEFEATAPMKEDTVSAGLEGGSTLLSALEEYREQMQDYYET